MDFRFTTFILSVSHLFVSTSKDRRFTSKDNYSVSEHREPTTKGIEAISKEGTLGTQETEAMPKRPDSISERPILPSEALGIIAKDHRSVKFSLESTSEIPTELSIKAFGITFLRGRLELNVSLLSKQTNVTTSVTENRNMQRPQ